MEKKNLYVLLIIIIIFQGCAGLGIFNSDKPEFLIRDTFDGDGIAVLNFSQSGNFPLSDAGKLAADKLTEMLFLKGNFKVIDRSLVNDKMITSGIKNIEFISADQISKIGAEMKANYIVLGRIQEESQSGFYSGDDEKKVFVSFRMISTQTNEVVGLVAYSGYYEKESFITDMEETISLMADCITKK